MGRKRTQRKSSSQEPNDGTPSNDNVSEISRLPDELVIVLLDRFRRDHISMLGRSLQVCRKWHDIGMPLMYKHLSFSQLEPLVHLGSTFKPIETGRRCRGGPMKDKLPPPPLGQHLVNYIRSITLYWPSLSGGKGEWYRQRHLRDPDAWNAGTVGDLFRSTATTVKMLESLEVISIHATYHDVHEIAALIKSIGPSVSSLELKMDIEGNRHYCNWRAHQPTAPSQCDPSVDLCQIIAMRITQFTSVNLCGGMFCHNIVTCASKGLGDGVLSVNLIDSNWPSSTKEHALHPAERFAARFESIYWTREQDNKTIRITSVAFPTPTSGNFDETRFDAVIYRDINRSAMSRNITPIRSLQRNQERNRKLPVYLRVGTPHCFVDHQAESWSDVVAMINPKDWPQEQDLQVRLPSNVAHSFAYKFNQLRWVAAPSASAPAVLSCSVQERRDIRRLLHEELFEYEQAAGRPLLLPIVDRHVFREVSGVYRDVSPQELNGDFVPLEFEALDLEEEEEAEEEVMPDPLYRDYKYDIYRCKV